MAKECYNTVSSNCVSNEGKSKSSLKTQTDFNDQLYKDVEDLKANTDMSSLRSPNNELNANTSPVEAIQYLLDNMNKEENNSITITGDSIQITVNLKTLTNSCNTGALSLNQFAQLVVDELVSLRQKVVILENKLNN